MGWKTQYRQPDRRAGWSQYGPGDFAFWLPVGFLLFLGMGALMHHLPWAIPVAYAVASILSAAFYADDKSKARSGEWRTPESTLHFIDFLGGWPGGMLAQRIVHHKNRKMGFQTVFWFGTLFHLAYWSWVFLKVPAETSFPAFAGKVLTAFRGTVSALLSASYFALPGV